MKKPMRIISLLLALLLLCSCGGAGEAEPSAPETPDEQTAEQPAEVSNEGEDVPSEGEPDSIQPSQMELLNSALVPQADEDAYRTTYEVFVYSFYDSDGDGIGDLGGLTEKLDYINDGDPASGDDLGCTMIWLMPVFPSPTYHKYDTTDYMDIDPQYGTLEDFDDLLAECHARGIRLILDLAINHTSSEHPWFTTAADYLRSLPQDAEPSVEECPYVDYYNFTREAANGYAQVPGTSWYYEARFWSGMPDLNLDSEAVRNEIAEITGFWLDRGVDGFRLDAVTSYYTESRLDSIAFMGWLTDTVKSQNPEAYLVAEGWADQGTYASYYESGIDSMFDFAFADGDGTIARVVKGTTSASAFGEAMESEEALYASYNPDYINAPFYTNHDMARSTGYYAWDDGSHTKLAGALNLLMTGNAFVYYGEELGMKGSGKDENKRAPMYWTEDADAEGMCVGPQDMESFEMKFPSLETQAVDPYSVYVYYRNAIRIRNSFPVIARGATAVVEEMSDKEICAFTRIKEGTDLEPVLVVINASEEAKTVPLSGDGADYTTLSAVLTVSEDQVALAGDQLTLPAFGIAVLTR